MTCSRSLASTFEDLDCDFDVLQLGIEPEFLALVQSTEVLHSEWRRLHAAKQGLQVQLASEREDVAVLSAQLDRVRCELEKQIRKCKRTEQERDAVVQQVKSIRQLLNDNDNSQILDTSERDHLVSISSKPAVHLVESGSVSSLHDSLSFSSVALNARAISTAIEPLSSSSLLKGDHTGRPLNANSCMTPTALVNGVGSSKGKDFCSFSTAKQRRSRSGSGQRQYFPGLANRPLHRDGLRCAAIEATDSSASTTPMDKVKIRFDSSRENDAIARLMQQHLFLPRTVRSWDTCTVCSKSLTLGKAAFRCDRCRVVLHDSCRAQYDAPCVMQRTPLGSFMSVSDLSCSSNIMASTRRLGIVSDYAPTGRPRIPALVVHCVEEIENRGVNTPGLYRVDGATQEVNALMETILKHGYGYSADLLDADVHVIGSVLKLFLSELREPLVTYAKWSEFSELGNNWYALSTSKRADVATSTCRSRQTEERTVLEQQLRVLLATLPRANRETLAFICKHLLKVEQAQASFSVDRHALAAAFGPAIVANSVIVPTSAQLAVEQPLQSRVVQFLLQFDDVFWSVYTAESELEKESITRAAKAALLERQVSSRQGCRR